MLTVVTSGKAAPGVSTSVWALALSWPRPLLVADCDPAGGDLAASAAIESVAENLSDAFVAPLFYFAVAGVFGALAYRAVNTLDAMVGYHGRYEYIGRVAARLDDLVNLVPARLTAAFLVAVAFLIGGSGLRALRGAWRDHFRTESPNAGWPMAAMAGALGVELHKVDHYRLGLGGIACQPAHVSAAVHLARGAAVLSTTLVAALLLLRGAT